MTLQFRCISFLTVIYENLKYTWRKEVKAYVVDRFRCFRETGAADPWLPAYAETELLS